MKNNSIKRLFCLFAAVLCMAAFSVSAFAAEGGYYASNEAFEETPGEAIPSISIGTEPIDLNDSDSIEAALDSWNIDTSEVSGIITGLMSALMGDSLTPGGNLTLIDDIYRVEGNNSEEKVLSDKQFITVETKNGSIFYLIIDRSGDKENVYFLNMVDDSDLLALLEDSKTDTPEITCSCQDKCEAGAVNISCSVCKTNMSECTGKEKIAETPEEPEKPVETAKPAQTAEKKNSSGGILLFIALAAVIGGVALYFIKFRNKKPSAKGSADLDDYFDEEDDEEMEREDDSEEETEETETAPEENDNNE